MFCCFYCTKSCGAYCDRNRSRYGNPSGHSTPDKATHCTKTGRNSCSTHTTYDAHCTNCCSNSPKTNSSATNRTYLLGQVFLLRVA